MPWKEVTPMDEKLLFIADHLRDVAPFTQLCQRYGISRKTGYKWVERYGHDGMDGLAERSRRPLRSTRTPYAIRQTILQLRSQRRDPPGPKKIHALLMQRLDEADVPSQTTIYNILRQAGQIQSRRRAARVHPGHPATHPASQPNELWSADYKGQFKLANGRWCYPLTVMDHASRFLLGCHGLHGTRLAPTRSVFERLFRTYGLPERIRTDNGVPFASLGVAGLSRLSVWWIRLGIRPERIKPGQPQQNGRHERMHRTLKASLGRAPQAHLAAQQRRLDAFALDYNELRPHESLGQQCPSSVYRPSPRSFPQRLPELIYPRYFQLSRVCGNGLIYWRSRRVYIGYLLSGEVVGIEPVADGLWAVFFGPVPLGLVDERQPKGPAKDYFSLKV